MFTISSPLLQLQKRILMKKYVKTVIITYIEWSSQKRNLKKILFKILNDSFPENILLLNNYNKFLFVSFKICWITN